MADCRWLEKPALLQGDPREVQVQLYRCVVKNYFVNRAGFVHYIFFQGVRVNSAYDIAGFGDRTLRVQGSVCSIHFNVFGRGGHSKDH